MPTVRKIDAPQAKGKRGRPKKNTMYTFRCSEGCEAQFMTKNAEAQCGKHHKEMKLV